MKNNSLFKFSKIERKGILFLGLSIFGLQMVFLLTDFRTNDSFSELSNPWMKYQDSINVLKSDKLKTKRKIYPFNPNFISDFKGYQLGMSVAEIDRLRKYREQNKYVNSSEDFQAVTKISDELLSKLSPYFKFPDWVKNRNKFKKIDYTKSKANVILQDINLATKEELMAVYGIGEALSSRIIKQREDLGAFVNMDQMRHIWGLSPEVIENLQKAFKVKGTVKLNKIAINEASLKELAAFPYFKYSIAKAIVTYRSMNGDVQNVKDLTKIKGFPIDNVDIIALYLDF